MVIQFAKAARQIRKRRAKEALVSDAERAALGDGPIGRAVAQRLAELRLAELRKREGTR